MVHGGCSRLEHANARCQPREEYHGRANLMQLAQESALRPDKATKAMAQE
jgi:hypothetical protein